MNTQALDLTNAVKAAADAVLKGQNVDPTTVPPFVMFQICEQLTAPVAAAAAVIQGQMKERHAADLKALAESDFTIPDTLEGFGE